MYSCLIGQFAALDPNTAVYCGHEYTSSNLKFAVRFISCSAACHRHCHLIAVARLPLADYRRFNVSCQSSLTIRRFKTRWRGRKSGGEQDCLRCPVQSALSYATTCLCGASCRQYRTLSPVQMLCQRCASCALAKTTFETPSSNTARTMICRCCCSAQPSAIFILT